MGGRENHGDLWPMLAILELCFVQTFLPPEELDPPGHPDKCHITVNRIPPLQIDKILEVNYKIIAVCK